MHSHRSQHWLPGQRQTFFWRLQMSPPLLCSASYSTAGSASVQCSQTQAQLPAPTGLCRDQAKRGASFPPGIHCRLRASRVGFLIPQDGIQASSHTRYLCCHLSSPSGSQSLSPYLLEISATDPVGDTVHNLCFDFPWYAPTPCGPGVLKSMGRD